MIRIPEIGISALEAFDACVENTQAARKAEFVLARLQLQSAEASYRQNAIDAVFSTQSKAIHGLSLLKTSDFGKLYKDKLQSKDVPAARSIYDKLRAHGASLGRCPYCGINQVKTLDHFLPKSQWPLFAVAPYNLVPCCRDCNNEKFDDLPMTPGEVPLHPYFDEIKGPWLCAFIEPKANGVLRFAVSPSSSSCPIQAARIRTHFKTFALAELYGCHAAQLLESSRSTFDSIRTSAGPESLKEHLVGMAASSGTAYPHGWWSVAFTTWASSNFFCHGVPGP